MNLLHPIFHTHSRLVGSRVGLEQDLPASLDGEDLDDLIDQMSEQPDWEERLAPLSVTIKNKALRGRNWTELLARIYGHCARMYTSVMVFVRQTLRNNLRESQPLPFTSLDIEPDALNRVIELDYETGDATYKSLTRMFCRGVVAPVVSIPFHPVLPLLRHDFDRRLVVRLALEFYWPILRRYHAFMRKTHEDHLFVTSIQLPEGAFTHAILKMVYEEYRAACHKRGIKDAHLVFLLDNRQAIFSDNDQLMKSWNAVQIYPDRDEFASVVFRDYGFSNWVQTANPSVKKLLDRTIAKVDASLNDMQVDYAWSHFDDIEALVLSDKSAVNFEQKIVKLIELGYVPVSPDVFVRRKLSESFGRAPFEPQIIRLQDNTAWSGWDGEHEGFSRWTGWREEGPKGKRRVDKPRRFTRRVKHGRVREEGSACWKIALHLVRDRVVHEAMGKPDDKCFAPKRATNNGMLGVLARIVPSDDAQIVSRNVTAFLVAYAYIYWRDHFLQHSEFSEAEIMLDELVQTHLADGCDQDIEQEEIVVAGMAAQAYYLALDSYRSSATYFENFDQRAVYEAALSLTLSVCAAVHVHHWLDQPERARQLVDLLRDELIDFDGAFKRHGLDEYGVGIREWKRAIKSTLEDCSANVVQRAARRTAARHLRDLGYTKEFPEEDEFLTGNCGHLWTAEIDAANYVWENKLFCGVKEE